MYASVSCLQTGNIYVYFFSQDDLKCPEVVLCPHSVNLQETTSFWLYKYPQVCTHHEPTPLCENREKILLMMG